MSGKRSDAPAETGRAAAPRGSVRLFPRVGVEVGRGGHGSSAPSLQPHPRERREGAGGTTTSSEKHPCRKASTNRARNSRGIARTVPPTGSTICPQLSSPPHPPDPDFPSPRGQRRWEAEPRGRGGTGRVGGWPGLKVIKNVPCPTHFFLVNRKLGFDFAPNLRRMWLVL